jgi:hypothetical protein
LSIIISAWPYPHCLMVTPLAWSSCWVDSITSAS